MINYPEKAVYTYDDLVDVLRILRAPDGCPWDREQTHQSNRRNFLEEAYEAAEAFDLDDPELMKEELGDMLMQVLFNIHMEEEAGRFTTDDVTDHVVRKLIFRHPFLFGGEAESWDELKQKEKGQKTTGEAMAGVARSLPATWRAEKIQKKAAKTGFRWESADEALDKLAEETGELREAVRDHTNIDEELGDVLLQQLSRYPLSVFDRRIDVPTAICVVLIDEAHERHFLFQSGQNLALRYEDLDEAVIRDSAFVSVGGAMALPELTGETGSPEKMA